MTEIAKRAWATRGVKRNDPESVSPTEIYKQLHETCRNAFTLYIGWFTFFITLNFAVLGWLAKADVNKQPEWILVIATASAFVVFAVLGMFSAATVKEQVRAAHSEIAKYLSSTADAQSLADVSVPAARYERNVNLTLVALLVFIVVWLVVIAHAF